MIYFFSLYNIFFISSYVHMCCYGPFIFNILLLTDKWMLSQPRDPTQVSGIAGLPYSFPSESLGKPTGQVEGKSNRRAQSEVRGNTGGLRQACSVY